MSEQDNLMTVNANVDITVESLQAIVRNAKEVAGTDEKGIYRIDTADKVSEIISKFLKEKDFESYALDIDNYRQ